MLSELPLSIIHVILALVPIRDAVKTSILSRQWRYTWASLPRLVFEDEYASFGSSMRRNYEKRMENFISNALFHHEGPIHKVKIHVPFNKSNPDIDEWMLCLARNDVRELILHMGNPTLNRCSSIYSCEKLTNLKLSYCQLDPPPSTFKGFLFLRCLSLHNVYLFPNGIESLVDNSPLLERLELLKLNRFSFGSSKLRISSPNLKYLSTSDFYGELCVSAPLLTELSVRSKEYAFMYDDKQYNSSVCNYANFMGGFTNLEKLHGDLYFTKYLSMGIESCHHSLVFHQLKNIELTYMKFKDINVVSVVARLIAGAPNLQKLEIENGKDDYASEDPYVYFGDFGCAPNVKFEKLRTVHMRCVTGLLFEMAFINFLLERSPGLETMRFLELTSKKQNLSARLQGCSPASPNVKLTVLASSSYNVY